MASIETALHICVASQFGSLSRLILKKLLGATVLQPIKWQKCDVWAFASCATQDAESGGALFQDLPSNAIGSFLLGLMSSAQAVGADVAKEVAVLSPDSPFQRYKALHTGIRTGFCGSLTTFSSWMLHVSILLFGAHDNQASRSPASAVLAAFLGTTVSLCSFQSGLYLARYLLLSANMRRAPPQPAGSRDSRSLQSTVSGNTICAPTGAEPTQPVLSSRPCTKLDTSSAGPIESDEAQSTHDHAIAVETQKKQGPTSCIAQQQGLISIAAWLLVSSSVCLTLAARQFSRDQLDWATFWLAGLLAPVGALLRWHLGALNSTPKRRGWKGLLWLPLGTLSANLAACTVGYLLLTTKAEADLAGNSLAAVDAVIGGALGSLSTASTWSAEIYSLSQDVESLHAFSYCMISILPAQIIGLLAYGWVGWR